MRWAWLVLILILVDSMMKIGRATPDWGWHVVETPWYLWAGVPVLALGALWRPLRIPLLLGVAGAVGNLLWTFNPRGVANPFVLDFGRPVAFNVADVYLTAAYFGLLFAASYWVVVRVGKL